MSGDRKQIGPRVDAELWADFREFVDENKGHSHSAVAHELENALREYMDRDRYARIEEKLDDLPEQVAEALAQDESERERKSSSNESNAPSISASTQTEKKLARIEADLPDNAEVVEAMLETPIEQHAGASYKTKKKYKDLLVKRGKVFEHPVDEGKFVVGRQKMALLMENNPQVTLSHLNDLFGQYDGILADDWYLEALPDEYVVNQDLRYQRLLNRFDGLELPSTEDYCREKGLTEPSIGVH